MTGCCSARAIADQFDRDTATEELRRYRREGPAPTTKALIDALVARGIGGADVLDIGAGVGAIHHALLERGARRAVHVDISSHNIDAARSEAERIGHAERVEFVTGDFVELAPAIAMADVVTLDRVICCYPSAEILVTRSAERARKLYGAVFPRERALVRIAIVLMNWAKCLRRSAFRSYLHSPAVIDELLRRAGFSRASTQRTWFWEIVIYGRSAVG